MVVAHNFEIIASELYLCWAGSELWHRGMMGMAVVLVFINT